MLTNEFTGGAEHGGGEQREGRGHQPEDVMLYAILARSSAVLGDVASFRRAQSTALDWAQDVPEALGLGVRLQVARGALVLRDLELTRTLSRYVLSKRSAYPLLAWEGARLLALVDGSVPPSPESFINGLVPASAEALEARPI